MRVFPPCKTCQRIWPTARAWRSQVVVLARVLLRSAAAPPPATSDISNGAASRGGKTGVTHTHTHNQHPVNIHTLSTYIPCQHTYPANTPFVITPPSTPPGTPAATRQGLASTGLPLPLPRSSYPCPPPSWGCCLLYAPSPRRTTTPTATRDQG